MATISSGRRQADRGRDQGAGAARPLVAAKRAARYLSTVLRHAEAGQAVPNAKLDDLVPEAAGERVLSDAEFRAVWLAADKLDPVWRDFTRGLLLTAKRRADLARARAEHVDAEAVVWHARVHKVRGPGVKVEAHPLSSAGGGALRVARAGGRLALRHR